MKIIYTFLLITICGSFSAYSQSATLKGQVKDLSGKPIPYINVKIDEISRGSATDQKGYYQISGLSEGKYSVKVSGIGYKEVTQPVEIADKKTIVQDFNLEFSIFELQSVEIIGRQEKSYQNDISFVASKTATPAIEIPQAISFVTKEVMNDQQVYRLSDAVANVGNVNQFSGYNDYTIRGFRSGSGSDRLINGLRAGFGFWNQPLMAHIERLEVIKGPASALFANTNPGGTINLVTKKPLNESRKSVSFTTGSFNTFRATADFTGPMNQEENLLFRLNLGYENSGSFRRLIDHESILIAPSFSFLPNENTKINVDAVYSFNKSKLDRGQPIFDQDQDLNSTPIEFSLSQPGDFQNIQDFYITISLNQKITDNLSFNSSFLKFSYNEDLEEHRTSNVFLPDDPSVMQMAYIRRKQEDNNYNISNYFTLNLDKSRIRHRILFGVDYWQQISNRSQIGARGDEFLIVGRRNSEGIMQVDSLPGGNVADFDLDDPQYSIARNPEIYIPNWFNQNWQIDPPKTYTTGLYVQDQIKFGENLNVLLGLRQEFFRTEVPSDEGVDIADQSAFLPRLGFTYSLLPDVNLYGTYTEGFEPQNASAIINQDIIGGPFDPEKSNMIEAGIKSLWMNGRLTANMAIYQIIKNNVLVNANDPGNPDLLRQRGQEKGRGVELEVMGKLMDNWNIIANYGYNRTEITEDVPGDPNNLVGAIKENAPLNSASLWTKYTIPNTALQGLGIGFGFQYVDERNTFERNLQLPAYTIFNSALYYGINQFEIAANFYNLTDQKYWVGGYNFGRIYPGAPRNFLVSVKYVF